MNTTIENLKKRIIYRSQYRGTKEMDKLLSAFVLKHVENFNRTQLLKLEKFLDIDDENLYKLYNGTESEKILADAEIINLFKNFKFNQL
tara:strand:- start:42 stop:308 length:267 start_codon:yes stop_codon:yes gene_type:complete